jgi:hypothetical protein
MIRSARRWSHVLREMPMAFGAVKVQRIELIEELRFLSPIFGVVASRFPTYGRNFLAFQAELLTSWGPPLAPLCKTHSRR